METAASFEVRNAPSSYPAVRASILPDRRRSTPAFSRGQDPEQSSVSQCRAPREPHVQSDAVFHKLPWSLRPRDRGQAELPKPDPAAAGDNRISRESSTAA
jgi:hypothetical protein